MGNGGGGDGSLSVLSPSACRKRFSIEAIVQMRKVLGGGWDRKKVGASAALFSVFLFGMEGGQEGKPSIQLLFSPICHLLPPSASFLCLTSLSRIF